MMKKKQTREMKYWYCEFYTEKEKRKVGSKEHKSKNYPSAWILNQCIALARIEKEKIVCSVEEI